MRAFIKYGSDEFAHPEDMKKILKYLRAHGDLQVSASTVENLYREYSAIQCAGWLFATDETIEDFANWLNSIEM